MKSEQVEMGNPVLRHCGKKKRAPLIHKAEVAPFLGWGGLIQG